MVKRYKKQDSVSYALGATLVMELLNKKPKCARAVYVSPKSDVAAVKTLAAELNVPVIESEKAINILSPKGNCFCAGVFDKFTCNIDDSRRHVVLVNPSDSGNLGTIMREIAAFDCADLAIIKPAVDPFDPKTVRASMGAVFDIRFREYDGFEQYLCEHGNRKVVPFMLGGAPFSRFDFDKTSKYSLVFGNEATGLDEDFGKYGAIKIEQSEKADSLNLSVAVAVALYKMYIS